MSAAVHISSLLVTARPERLGDVVSRISAMQIAEVAATDPAGKIIVTLETGSEAAIVQGLTDIQLLPGVVSAALVYHQADPDTPAAASPQPEEPQP